MQVWLKEKMQKCLRYCCYQYGAQHLGGMIFRNIKNHSRPFVPIVSQRAQPDLIHGRQRSLIR